jgi:hypothetical protein
MNIAVGNRKFAQAMRKCSMHPIDPVFKIGNKNKKDTLKLSVK